MTTTEEAVRRLAIESRSTGLDETTAKLNAMSTAHEGVAVASQKSEKATQSMQARLNSIQRQYDAVYRAEQALARVERDLANAQRQGLITNQRRLELLSLAAEKHGLAASAINREIGATERLANVQRAQMAANQNMRGVGPINTANIAAQFQDIGVTAAMGMNPLQIALQQGTQLSAVLGPMGAAGAVRSLGAAFVSIINPVSLVTLGLVGLTAAAIQYFMKSEDGSEKVDAALQKQQELIAGVAKRWGDAVPAIKAYNDEVERTKELEDALRAAGILGRQQYEGSRTAVSTLTSDMADLVSILNRAGVDQNLLVTLQHSWDDLQKKVSASTATSEDARTVQQDLLTLLQSTGIPIISDYADEVGILAQALAVAAAKASKLHEEAALLKLNEGLSPLNRLNVFRSTPFQTEEEIMFERSRRQREAEEGRIGGIGIPTPAPRPNDIERLDWATAAAEAASKASRRATADFDRSIERIRARTAALEAEAAVVGMSTFAAAKYLETQRLEAEARKDAIGLTPERIALIDAETSAYARRAAATEEAAKAERRLSEEMAFRRDLMGGALNDIRGALADGKLTWEELGNVAINALNKILDKLQNELLDAIFDLNKAAGTGGGGGGLLGSILGLLGLGGGGGFSAFEMAWTAAVPGLWAKGGAFDGGNVIPFAKGGAVASSNIMPFAAGGAFTNSIVDRPTLFPISNGAGLMGEAGPEAIMPLKRGPDGRLGVSSNGGGQQTVTVAPVINIDARNAQPGVGTEIEAAVRRATADMTPAVVKALREIKRKGIAV